MWDKPSLHHHPLTRGTQPGRFYKLVIFRPPLHCEANKVLIIILSPGPPSQATSTDVSCLGPPRMQNKPCLHHHPLTRGPSQSVQQQQPVLATDVRWPEYCRLCCCLIRGHDAVPFRPTPTPEKNSFIHASGRITLTIHLYMSCSFPLSPPHIPSLAGSAPWRAQAHVHA